MSICPKNKSSKARRDKRRANWKMSAPNLVKCSKMWRTYDATQSLQSLWILQQERNRYCRKLIKKAIVQELGVLLNSFSF